LNRKDAKAARKSLDTKDTKDTKDTREDQDKCEPARRQDAKKRQNVKGNRQGIQT